MVAPTLPRKTDDNVDATNIKYGAPDVLEIVQVIEGDHPLGEKIQAAQVENAVTLTGAQTITDKTIAYGSNTLTDVASLTTAQTLTTKTMDALNNTFTRVLQAPEKKWMAGFTIHNTPTNAWGPITTGNAAGTTQTPSSATEGVFRRYVTGTTAGNQAGVRIAPSHFNVDQNPRLRTRFKFAPTGTTTSYKLWVGFVFSGTLPATDDDPINARESFLMAIRSTDTNLMIGHNDAAGAGVYIDTGLAKTDTGNHTMDLQCTNGTCYWQLDGGTVNSVTTDIPPSTTVLGVWSYIETQDAGNAKSLDQYYLYLEWDNIAG